MSVRTSRSLRFWIFSCLCMCFHLANVEGQSFVNWESPHVHPLDLTPNGNTLLAVNTADNRLEIFTITAGMPVHIASVPVGLDPVSVRARSNTEAWVINHVSDSFSIVDIASARVVRTVGTGDEPADVIFAGSPQRAFVTVSQLNQVRVWDPASILTAPTIIAIQGEDPRALAVDAAGTRVFAAIFESGNHTTNLTRQQVSNPAGPYGGQNPPPNAGTLFNPPITAGLPPPPPVALIVRKIGGQWMDDNAHDWSSLVTWDVHDQDVAIIDTSTLAVTYATGVMTTPMSLAVTPSGNVTVVGTEARNEIRFEPNLTGTFLRVNMASFAPGAPASITTADLNPHLNYLNPNEPQATRDLSIGDPRAIVWNGAGNRGYVAGMGSNNVVVINSGGGRITNVNVGEGPTGLAINDSQSRLYVLNKFAGTISVVDTAADSNIGTVTFFDPTPPAIKAGRPFLYDTHRTSGLGQVSCASCHIDGRTDHLGWDLGNPAGQLKAFNEVCRAPNTCEPWHPMKGPMVTQTLQGIVGNEPFHWRGDRENLAAFDVAFTGLQGADAPPSAGEMQQFTDFVATIRFPSNPNRNIDATMPAGIATSNGTGNPNNGQNIFINQPVLPGGLTCVACHALPDGTDLTIDSPPGLVQQMKIAQLRNMHEKAGANRGSLTANRGFGFNHDSDFDTIFNLLGPPFTFAPGPAGQQQRRDVEAFLLCFSTDTHPAVGRQITFDGTNNNDVNLITLLNTFQTLANAGSVSFVARGLVGGQQRGYAYIGGGTMQSDRQSETVSVTALRVGSTSGGEVTFTVVPTGSQTRIGLDRDSDGYFDRDELDACSDPANAASIPTVANVDIDNDGDKDLDDVAAFTDVLTGINSDPAQISRSDVNCDGAADGRDIPRFVAGFLSP